MKIPIYEAAKFFCMSYAALLNAAKAGKLKYERIKGKYFVLKKDVQSYLANRYCRETRKHSGKIIHDKENLSPFQTAKYLDTDVNYVYYELKKGRLPHAKINRWYVIKLSDVEKYKIWMKNERLRNNSDS